MIPVLSIDGLRSFAASAPSDRYRWFALLAPDCALRIGSRPTIYGRAEVEAHLSAFLEKVERFGRCGCDILSAPDHWIVETDVSLQPHLGSRPKPCVIAIRTGRALIKDLRFYLD